MGVAYHQMDAKNVSTGAPVIEAEQPTIARTSTKPTRVVLEVRMVGEAAATRTAMITVRHTLVGNGAQILVPR